jgi:hypothetical protein
MVEQILLGLILIAATVIMFSVMDINHAIEEASKEEKE